MDNQINVNMKVNQSESISAERIRDIPFSKKEVDIINSCSSWMKFIGYISFIGHLLEV